MNSRVRNDRLPGRRERRSRLATVALSGLLCVALIGAPGCRTAGGPRVAAVPVAAGLSACDAGVCATGDTLEEPPFLDDMPAETYADYGILPVGGELDPAESEHCVRGCDFPKYAIPAPLGTYVRGWQGAQILNADAGFFVIYDHEWYQGGDRLGPMGRAHVHDIAVRLPHVPFPVVIEPAPVVIRPRQDLDDAIAEAAALTEVRRMLVVSKLLTAGIVDAEVRVVIARPHPEGLDGNQAPLIYWQMQRGMMGGRGGMGRGMGGFGGGMGGFGGGMGGMGGMGGFGGGMGGMGGFGGVGFF